MSNKILLGVVGALLVLIGGLVAFIFLSSQKSDVEDKNLTQEEDNLIQEESKEEKKETQSKEVKDSTSVRTEKYIVAEKSGLIPGGGRKHEYFAVYDLQGKLINKVVLPDDAMPDHVNSNNTFGSKIYYLSGSEKTTSIAELDPVTGKSHIFDFTKTESTNVGNVLAAIVGWTVSDDNQKLAWIDTECMVHIANSDGTNLKSYQSDDGKCINSKVEFAKDKNLLYVWDGEGLFLKELIIDSGVFRNIVKSENGEFLISPSNRYIIYSNFETPLAIRDLTVNKDVPIVTPEKYTFYEGKHFSEDEKTVYFRGTIFRGKSDDYVVQTDGSNLRKITGTDESEEVGKFLSSPEYEEEYFVGVVNLAD